MKQKLTMSTAMVLLIILVASLSKSEVGFMLMMSTAREHNIARIVLVGVLVAMVMTTRPRSKAFRAGLAILSTGITAYALTQTANFELQLFDTLVYLLAGIILMTESLETEHSMALSSSVRRGSTKAIYQPR